MFLWFGFPFWTFLSCCNFFFLSYIYWCGCQYVSVGLPWCVCGDRGQLVRLCCLLSYGSWGLPISQPAVISLVSPVFRKLPFWAASDCASYSLSFPFTCLCFLVLVSHSSCGANSSARWTSVPVLIPLLYSTMSSMLFSLIAWLLSFQIENRCFYAAFWYSLQKSRSLQSCSLRWCFVVLFRFEKILNEPEKWSGPCLILLPEIPINDVFMNWYIN